jgi:hypothetical protein
MGKIREEANFRNSEVQIAKLQIEKERGEARSAIAVCFFGFFFVSFSFSVSF